MLAITRKVGERIEIGSNGLILEVIKVSGKKVVLGFAGDDSLEVYREEVAQKRRERNNNQLPNIET